MEIHASVIKLLPGTSKSPDSSLSLRQRLNLNHRRCINPLQNKLSNPITNRNYSLIPITNKRTIEINIGMIKQQNLQRSPIILIHNPSTSVNKMFHSYPH